MAQSRILIADDCWRSPALEARLMRSVEPLRMAIRD
jgi:hypothetical protein